MVYLCFHINAVTSCHHTSPLQLLLTTRILQFAVYVQNMEVNQVPNMRKMATFLRSDIFSFFVLGSIPTYYPNSDKSRMGLGLLHFQILNAPHKISLQDPKYKTLKMPHQNYKHMLLLMIQLESEYIL